MSHSPRLHLASSSPRRREILQTLGLNFTSAGVALEESRLDNEPPEEMVMRLAEAKAMAATVAENRLVLGSDTAVVLGERVYGKPRDRDHAVEMLLALSGKTHVVLTGVALRTQSGTRAVLSSTDVRFRTICRDEAIRYWQSDEPRDKAGAYAIQGLGSAFVETISGSYSGVMGLPVFETLALLREAGIDLFSNGNH